MVFMGVNVYNYFHHVFFASLAEDTHKLFSFQRAIQHSNHFILNTFLMMVVRLLLYLKRWITIFCNLLLLISSHFFNINSNICAYNYLLKTEIRFYKRLQKSSASTCHKNLSCAKWDIFSMSCISITFFKVCIRSSSRKDANEKDERYKSHRTNMK